MWLDNTHGVAIVCNHKVNGARGERTMSYDIEISRRDVSYYSEAGDWLDGDSREISDEGTVTDTFDAADGDDTFTWARDVIGKTDAREASVYPVPAECPEHVWLSGSYEDPYGRYATETTARLTGDWTPAERARVFAYFAA